MRRLVERRGIELRDNDLGWERVRLEFRRVDNPRPVVGAPRWPRPTYPSAEGKILSDAKVVVTQPTAGTFKAFSAVCTHAGCLVGSVADGEIVCPCHGSHFSIKDGSVAGGPAPTALPAKTVTAEGSSLKIT